MIFSIEDKTLCNQNRLNYPNLHISKMDAMSKMEWKYCDYILWFH